MQRVLLDWEVIKINNFLVQGQCIKATFVCDTIGAYKSYYLNKLEFLDDIKEDKVPSSLMDILERKRKGMLDTEVLKKDLCKIIGIGARR